MEQRQRYEKPVLYKHKAPKSHACLGLTVCPHARATQISLLEKCSVHSRPSFSDMKHGLCQSFGQSAQGSLGVW